MSTASDLVARIAPVFPAVTTAVDELVSPSRLAPVLRALLRDGISIRHSRRILELLLRYETSEKSTLEPDRLVFVRHGMADVIGAAVSIGPGTVVAYLLDPSFERLLSSGMSGHGADEVADRLLGSIRDDLASMPAEEPNISILTTDELRQPLADLLRPEFPFLHSLGYRDLPPEHNVQPLARLTP